MKSKVGRTERARFPRNFLGGIDVRFAAEIAAPFLGTGPKVSEFFVKEFSKCWLVSRRAFERCESVVEVLENRLDRKAGFGCGGKMSGSIAQGDLFERPQKIQELIDISVADLGRRDLPPFNEFIDRHMSLFVSREFSGWTSR